jgi:hypothetical protein
MRKQLFAKNDGFDVYIDSARFLPDNASVCSVVAFVASNKLSIAGRIEGYVKNTCPDVYNPSFGIRREFRAESFDPTLTLFIQINTVSARTGVACVIGFAVLNIFVDAETGEQPKTAACEFVLNAGSFQLPIRRQGLPEGTPLSVAVLDAAPIVSCASVLVRIVPALISPSSNLPMSTKTAGGTLDEWVKSGLVVLSKFYRDGAYDSSRCRPSANEKKLYRSRLQRPPLSVRDAVVRLREAEGGTAADVPEVIPPAALKALLALPQNEQPGMLDMRFAFKYHPPLGFHIAVDGARNLAKPLVSYAVVSLHPGSGLYDHSPPLTEGALQFLKLNAESEQKCPRWTDDFIHVKDMPFTPNLFAVIDIRCVQTHSTGLFSKKLEKPAVQPQGFAILPMFGSEPYVLSGSLQLPLYDGIPTSDITAQLTANGVEAGLTSLITGKKLSTVDGASVFVRFVDDARLGDYPDPMARVSMAFIPPSQIEAYKAIRYSAKVSRLVPKDSTPEQYFTETVRSFEEAIGFVHV